MVESSYRSENKKEQQLKHSVGLDDLKLEKHIVFSKINSERPNSKHLEEELLSFVDHIKDFHIASRDSRKEENRQNDRLKHIDNAINKDYFFFKQFSRSKLEIDFKR